MQYQKSVIEIKNRNFLRKFSFLFFFFAHYDGYFCIPYVDVLHALVTTVPSEDRQRKISQRADKKTNRETRKKTL